MIVILLILCSLVSSQFTQVIQTSTGPLFGLQNGVVNQYLGIPYAEPPIGPNRWKATIPKSPWSPILHATTFSDVCPQPIIFANATFGLQQSEDCLYLNIYAPSSANIHSALPVIFWIHGGGYFVGSGNLPIYDGTDLASEGNIVVTMNYRIGVLGFLGLAALQAEDPHHSTGNYGLNDMQVALQWVQDNIQSFGGDENEVTIWGESAGCNAVLANLASPRSRGLFARAMCDSGSYEQIAHTLDYAFQEGHFLANQIGCLNAPDMLRCLRGFPADALVGIWFPCSFTVLPTVDGYQLTDLPLNVIGTSNFNPVPLLIGTNHDEGSWFAPLLAQIPIDLTADQYSIAFARYAFLLGYSPSDAAGLQALYPLASYPSPFWAASDFGSDALMICPTLIWLQKYSQSYPDIPLFVYSFNYNQSLMNYWGFVQAPLGATHSSELDFIWHPSVTIDISPPNSQPLADKMQTYYRAFVQSKNANSLNEENMIHWPKFRSQNPRNIVFDIPLSTEDNFGKLHACNALATFTVGAPPACGP